MLTDSSTEHSPVLPIVMACHADLVHLRDVPDELIAPRVRHLVKNCLYRTCTDHFSLKRVFMRVTRRGTVLFTAPTADDTQEKDECVIGAFRLQDVAAMLPVYDVETLSPKPNFAAVVRRVRPANPSCKIIGDGTESMVVLSMSADGLERLASLVMATGGNTVDRYQLVCAYRIAKPLAVRFVDGDAAGTAEKEDRNASQRSLSPQLIGDQSDEELEAALGISSEHGDQSDEELEAALGISSKHGDQSDEELEAALGIESSVRFHTPEPLVDVTTTSKPRPAPSMTQSATSTMQSALSTPQSAPSKPQSAVLLNPLKLVFGMRRGGETTDSCLPLDVSLAYKEATRVSTQSLEEFFDQEDERRRREHREEAQRVRGVLAKAREAATMIRLMSRRRYSIAPPSVDFT